ncbi:hypothetical protein FO519_006153 [Halicephalobus sp. NKZ332]|nr:hypothetical protein FO519_006153 [Halicephalobus sp. NKZ332]
MKFITQLFLMVFFVLLSTVLSLNSTEKSPYCVFHNSCYKDSDCGPRGHCVGHLVGKCDCDACVNGGLNAGCDLRTHKCDCLAGHKANGFGLFSDVATNVCRRDCNGNSHSCFGLPCNMGRCVCGFHFERVE